MLNQVCIAGNLGQDPELRYTQTGLAITNLNIAVNEFFKDSNGDSQKRTHWFRATAFGRTAEIAAEYLRKGSKLGIAGQLVQRSWEDQNGNPRSSIEIRVNQLELMATGNGNQSYNGNANSQHAQPPQQQQQTRSRQPSGQLPPGEDLPEPPPYYADDIPF